MSIDKELASFDKEMEKAFFELMFASTSEKEELAEEKIMSLLSVCERKCEEATVK